MEAVIATGGKQYRVATGQVISVEKLAGDKGSAIQFTSVLLVNREHGYNAARAASRTIEYYLKQSVVQLLDTEGG